MSARPYTARAVGRVRAWARQRTPDELALGLPLVIAVVYFVRMGQTFQERLTLMSGDSDAIFPLVIVATMDEVPDADIQMGTFGHYMTLAYARATEWLPFYREVWEAMPFILWMASLGLVVWAAWRTFGEHAAVLTGVLALCVGPSLLYTLFTSTNHTWTVYSSAIAVGLVVFLTTQTRMSTRSWIIAVAAALVLGGAVAEDRLVLLGAIGPLLLAGRRGRDQASDPAGTHGRARGGARRRRGGRHWRGHHEDRRGVGLPDRSENRGLDRGTPLLLTGGCVPGGEPVALQCGLLRAVAVNRERARIRHRDRSDRRARGAVHRATPTAGRCAAGRHPSRTRQVGVHLLLGGDDGHRPARRHRE